MRSVSGLILLVLITTLTLYGAKVTTKVWEKSKTFSDYLQEQNISHGLLNAISQTDMAFLSDIEENQHFYELHDTNGTLLQTLIPISEEMQIRLAKEHHTNTYLFDIIPIAYERKEGYATVSIARNLHLDICKALNHSGIADKMSQLFKNTIDATKFHKGDKVSFVYKQKTRMGRPFGMPQIEIAHYSSKRKTQFIYADEEGYGYTTAQKSQPYTVKSKKKVTYQRKVLLNKKEGRFGMPLRHVRVTSPFSYSRYHPILKKYRPHHGTDFGAKKGTPLLAVNAGRVTYAGRMGGYGKVVKIKHSGGYESLYAHQSRMRVKRGQQVKKGQIIGYVGSTGRSTGPHLHFGLKKYGRWIDPMKVLKKKSIVSSVMKQFTTYKEVETTKYKYVEIKNAKENKEKLLAYLAQKKEPFIWSNFTKTTMRIKDDKPTPKL